MASVLDRRAFIAAVTGSLLAWPLADEPQAVEKVWRIGYFSAGSSQYDKSRRISFVEGLRGLGYVQGQNIIIETRYPNGDQTRLAELAADLVQRKIDIIVTSGNPATIAARQATATIPIVMLLGVDPIGLGLIASFRRPGGNVTGLSWDPSAPEMMAKNVEFLKEAVSSLARVGILYPHFPGLEPYRKARRFAVPSCLYSASSHHVLLPNPCSIAVSFPRLMKALGRAYPQTCRARHGKRSKGHERPVISSSLAPIQARIVCRSKRPMSCGSGWSSR
jgi:hypothetical protein